MSIPIPREIEVIINDICRKHSIAPKNLFQLWAGEISRIWSGEKMRQPFLIEIEKIKATKEIDRYLKTLYYLWKGNSEKFETVVLNYRGCRRHKRRLFARSRDEIETTGSSNSAKELFDSGLFVSANMSGYQKKLRIEYVMCDMGFTPDYAKGHFEKLTC